MEEDKFLEHFNRKNEFWDEKYKSTIITMIELSYKPQHIKYWGVSDIVFNDDKVLIKWFKRLIAIDDDKLKEMYPYEKF